MISLFVSEGYAFDYLAILQVKFEKTKTVESYKNFIDCKKFLEVQLGQDYFNKIYASQEFLDLLEANFDVWKLVDLAKNNQITAQEVDHGNFVRWKNKQKLQEKFFSNQGLNEQKVGYHIYEN